MNRIAKSRNDWVITAAMSTNAKQVAKANGTVSVNSRRGCGALDAPQLPGQEQEGLNVRIAGSRAPRRTTGPNDGAVVRPPGAGEAGIGA